MPSLPRQTLARNLCLLMERHGLSCADLAKASGVSAKAINNMQRCRASPSLDTVEAVARVFGLNLWHLIMPGLPDDLVESPAIRKLVETFAALPPEGREHVEQTARREATFARINDKP